MSVPFISASLHNLIPIVFFIAFQIMNTMANTVPLIAITSNNFVPKFAPEFVIGTASVSQIPANISVAELLQLHHLFSVKIDMQKLHIGTAFINFI